MKGGGGGGGGVVGEEIDFFFVTFSLKGANVWGVLK